MAAPHLAPWPVCEADERAAVERVLRSGRLNYWTGEEGRQFEREFAAYVGTAHAVAVTSGTAALELALRALGISPGDEVVLPCRAFIACASAVVRFGATPVFADVDRVSQNITADAIRERLSPRTKAVIAVHLAGWPCDMAPIMELATKHDLAIVEDCAQAHGARDRGRPVGSMGNVGVFSFCHDKIMTTGGEGGMLVTDLPDLWRQAWSLKEHGKNFDAAYPGRPSAARRPREHASETSPLSGFRWLHHQIGTNWRMTEIQAAIGRVVLGKVDGWVETRRRNAAILNDSFSSLPALRTTLPPDEAWHSYYKYYVFVRRERLAAGWSRDRIREEINRAGMPCFDGSCSEIYLEKAFDPSVRPAERLPVARELGETSLMFPVHPTLGESHVRQMGQVARNVVLAAMM